MKIFLSSTFRDLKDIRQIALNFLEGIVGHVTNSTGEVVAMEYFNASERSCKEECLNELSTCDLVIGIYGDKYGSVADDGRSMTETEFDYAVEHGIPVLAFVKRAVDREEEQSRFISEKVHGSQKSGANFEGPIDFAARLNDSLKEYLGEYDGYSVNSLWEQVAAMKAETQQKMAEGDREYYLKMLPYESGDEDLALDSIITFANGLQEYVVGLGTENNAVHSYAYLSKFHPSQLTPDHDRQLCQNVAECADQILQNWELIFMGINNHTTAIRLAATYLKLKRMQQRLLTEPWTEKLRQEVITVRKEYIDTINDSSYID